MVKLFRNCVALAALVTVLGAGSVVNAAQIRGQVARHLYPERGFFVHNTCHRHLSYANQGYYRGNRYGR